MLEFPNRLFLPGVAGCRRLFAKLALTAAFGFAGAPIAAAVDQEARVQLSRQQTQLAHLQQQVQGLESWRSVLTDESAAIKQRYDGLHEVQRELNAQFLALRGQHSDLLAEWGALRAGHETVGSRLAEMVAQVRSLADESQRNETRIAQVESQLGGRAALQLMNQVDALNSELARLRGQVEVLANNVENAQKRQRDMYLDLDTRMRRIEQQDSAGAQKKNEEAVAALEERVKKLEHAAAALAAIPAPVTAVSPSLPAPSGDPQRAYETALNLYRVADYQGAIAQFEELVRRHPQHALAPNAQYWIGDAYFQLRDYRSSIEAQRRLIALYPDSAKVPDALLNIGSSELGLGEAAAARRSWEDLVARYPNSESAGKARERLARLR